ncbi:MAG: hypothetical protein CVT92_05845 [Bacteroidetes bacterium HGW-Bacteroidetes-1]|jgi:hypothetical protein|nr:MAG: hypothetical protein CVT92_05845 [Bacteroidetes bacterium HGW-Bacteroidetes-1]
MYQTLFKGTIFFSLLILTFLFNACSPPLPKEESQKHLRAFDNEMIQLFNRVGNTEAMRSLISLYKINEVPLPLFSFTGVDTITGYQTYDFQKSKGVYYFQADLNRLVKRGESDSVIILFPFKSRYDSLIRFVLSDYGETSTALQMMFPERLHATLYAGSTMLLKMNFQATIKHGMPAKILWHLVFADYNLRLSMKTRFMRTKGVTKVSLVMKESNKPVLNGDITTEVIVTDNNTLVFNKKKIDVEVYPIKIRLQSDYSFLEGKPSDFFSEFNRNSSFKIYNKSNRLMGDIKFTRLDGLDRVNLMFIYPDGSVENLEDMLLVARTILNMKIVNTNKF